MGWIDAELALTALAAMLSPTTLTFSVLVLVLGDRPLRTGLWFYLGALGATLGIGVVAAFVLGNAAASSTPSTPKTWVAVLDVLLALGLLVLVVGGAAAPAEHEADREHDCADAEGRLVAGRGDPRRGRRARQPGRVHPDRVEGHLRARTRARPSTSSTGSSSRSSRCCHWRRRSCLLLLAPDWTKRALAGARGWLERNARNVAAVIVILLALSLLRNGIAGLTG